MVTIKTFGGLSNRMMAIASAEAMSRYFGQNLKIIWNPDAGLNSKFNSLFHPIPNLEFVSQGFLTKTVINKFKKTLPYLFKKYLSFKYQRALLYNDVEGIRQSYPDTRIFFNQYKSYTKIYIENCHIFYPLDKGFDIFKPLDHILHRIENVTREFNANTIGLHIRRTDNEYAIKHSPLFLFIKLIDEIILNNKNANFYLATDDPAIFIELKSLYSNRILHFSKNKRRDIQIGIEEALIDLFSLSQTQKIYGSAGSTFSMVAAILGKKELEIIMNNN